MAAFEPCSQCLKTVMLVYIKYKLTLGQTEKAMHPFGIANIDSSGPLLLLLNDEPP